MLFGEATNEISFVKEYLGTIIMSIVGVVGSLAGAIAYLVKAHEARLDKKDELHQARLDKKEEECRKERECHREERQEEGKLNREVHERHYKLLQTLNTQLSESVQLMPRKQS